MTVPVARKNTFFHKGKFLISVLAVASALTLIMLMFGLRAGLYATLTAYVDNIGADLIIAQSGVKGIFSSSSVVDLDIHEEIAALTNASEAGHIIVADVIFTKDEIKTPVILVGYDPDTEFGSPWKVGEGTVIGEDTDIMLDAWLAKRSGIEVCETVTLLGENFHVIGLTKGTSSWMSPYIFTSLDAAESLLGFSGSVSYHLLKLPTGANVTETQELIRNQFEGVEPLTPSEIAEADRRILATIMDTPILVLLTISIVIAIAVMGLTAYTSISDRIREYGVLKAIGAGRAILIRLVIQETLYQVVFGYFLSVGLTYFSAWGIMALWPQFNILIEPQTVIQTGLLALPMMLIAALLPIRRLESIDPISVFKN